MEKFHDIKSAMREIKRKLDNKEYFLDGIILLVDKDNTVYWVLDDTESVCKILNEAWYDSPEGEPEFFVENYGAYQFVESNYKLKWTFLYRNFKDTYLSEDHIRGELSLYGETVTNFGVNSY